MDTSLHLNLAYGFASNEMGIHKGNERKRVSYECRCYTQNIVVGRFRLPTIQEPKSVMYKCSILVTPPFR